MGRRHLGQLLVLTAIHLRFSDSPRNLASHLSHMGHGHGECAGAAQLKQKLTPQGHSTSQ